MLSLLLLALLCMSHAYQMGAPQNACREMTPGHGFAPRSTPMPYNITLSGNMLQQGKPMTLSISRGEEPPFRGFFVQVRRASQPDSSEALGRFITKQHVLVSCDSGTENAISHGDGKEKEAVTLLWESPPDLDEDVVFRTTVVQQVSTFWVNHDSPRVRVSRSGDVPPAAAADEPTPPPTAQQPERQEQEGHGMTDVLVGGRKPPAQSAAIAEQNQSSTDTTTECTRQDCDKPVSASNERGALASVYDGCFLSKGCFPKTDGCIQSRSCDLMLTHARLADGTYRLQLYGKYDPGHYLAVGFSRDDEMGSDAVVYCTSTDDGGFQILHAYNHGKSSVPEPAVPKTGQLVTDFNSEYNDGYLICEFTHTPRFEVSGDQYDLTSRDLFLLVAAGTASADPERRPQYHFPSGRQASSEPVQLGSFRPADGGGGTDLLYRVHGSLMIAAWVGTASVGMLVARYYKQTWAGRQLAGLDLWFQAHRTLMVLTVLLTIAGFVVIMVQLGGWTQTPLFGGPVSNLHPLLGIICFCLALLQPLIAMCRCHPGTPKRPIFNWVHWLVGTAAHIVAIAAMFLAVDLPAAQLPFWTFWVLAAFVAFYVLVHLIMSIQQCWSDRAQGRQKSNEETFGMRDMSMNGYSAYQSDRPLDAPGSTFRRTVLGIYIVIVALFVALLIVMVVLAPASEWFN